MDVIIIGIYSAEDQEKINDAVRQTNNLEIEWDYKKYNIESSEGINVLEKAYGLKQTGILIERNREQIFSSFPIICEVQDSYLKNDKNPQLFEFFGYLTEAKITKMIIAFADEWEKETLVKVEKCSLQLLKNRLNRLFVWCDSYKNLIDNVETRDDYHPLVLEIG